MPFLDRKYQGSSWLGRPAALDYIQQHMAHYFEHHAEEQATVLERDFSAGAKILTELEVSFADQLVWLNLAFQPRRCPKGTSRKPSQLGLELVKQGLLFIAALTPSRK